MVSLVRAPKGRTIIIPELAEQGQRSVGFFESVPDLPRSRNPAPEHTNATVLEPSNCHLEVCLDRNRTENIKEERPREGRYL